MKYFLIFLTISQICSRLSEKHLCSGDFLTLKCPHFPALPSVKTYQPWVPAPNLCISLLLSSSGAPCMLSQQFIIVISAATLLTAESSPHVCASWTAEPYWQQLWKCPTSPGRINLQWLNILFPSGSSEWDNSKMAALARELLFLSSGWEYWESVKMYFFTWCLTS